MKGIRCNSDLPFAGLLGVLIFCAGCLNPKQQSQTTENSSARSQMPMEQHPSLNPQIGEYVVEIFEDSKGHLWFGTIGKGVARYDGKQLVYFTTEDGLAGNTVTCITEDAKGNLWLATHSGLSKFNGKTFKSYFEKDGLCYFRVAHLLVDKKGMLWIGTWAGVCLFDGTTFTDVELPIPEIAVPPYQETENWVTEIMEDGKGNVWIGRSGYGACKFDGKTFTTFTKKEGLPSNCVQEILEDNQGNIWFGTRVAEKDSPDFTARVGEGGLSKYDGKSFTQFTSHDGLHKNDIYALHKDKKGHIWIGANGHGLYQYNGTTFNVYSGTDRMDLTKTIGIQSILEDKNGTIWLGFSGGLFQLRGDSIVNIVQGDF